MLIYIEELITGKSFPLEAESFDTIDYIKELIKAKKGICQFEYSLLWDGMRMRGSETLAHYKIENKSTIDLHYVQGGMHLLIETFPEKKPFSMVVRSSLIGNLKAYIEDKTGIPVNGQSLLFSGRELDDDRTLGDYGIEDMSTLRLVRLRIDGDDVVDIAALREIRKAALSKGKGTRNRVDQVGSKRAREDSSYGISEAGFSSRGANRVEGVESFWDEEDFGLAWRRSRSLISPYDTIGFESKSRRTLAESVANDCVRTLNVTAFLERQLQESEDKLSRAEEEVKRLKQELIVERSTGASFLQSEAGRRHIVTLERGASKTAIDDFKESATFKEIVTNGSMSVYDDVVKECQRLLRESGQVSETEGEGEGEKAADSKKLMEQLDVERSTGSFFLKSEIGRRHIVCLQRQAAKSGVEEFKESADFEQIVTNRAMSVYDDVVKECQRLLRESGQVSEDVIQLIDIGDSDHDEGEGEKAADSEKLMQELDLERSTGSFFLKSEVGRRYIVFLQREAAKCGVEEFKESADFEQIVTNRAMSVYDDVVKECQRLLRESGRVSEDVIRIIDPHNSVEFEDED